jgi:hypothetical protein
MRHFVQMGCSINFQDGWQTIKFAPPSQRKQAKPPSKTSTSQRKLKIGITPQNIWKHHIKTEKSKTGKTVLDKG